MADEPKLEKQKSLARPPSLVAADDRGTVKDSFIGQGQLNIGGNLPVRESSAFESSSAPLVTRETAIELPTVVELDLAAAAGAAPSRGSAGSKSERPRIQWDEEAIAEHDKTRGTRMVIDEPKTPYCGPAQEGDLLSDGDNSAPTSQRNSVTEGQKPEGGLHGALQLQLGMDLTSKLEGMKEEEDAEAEKKRKFAEMRSKHYQGMSASALRNRAANMHDSDESDGSQDEEDKQRAAELEAAKRYNESLAAGGSA
eukprot:gene231-382_t